MTQSLCGVADLALAGQEYQDITGRFGRQFVDGVDDGLGLVSQLGAHHFVVRIVGIVGVVGRDRDLKGPVPDLDRIRPARHLDNRGAIEVGGKPLRLDRRGGDDHLEVGPPRQQLA